MRASPRRGAGFTLIEIMAVVLIMGLMMAFVVPSLSTVRSSTLRDGAIRLAGSLELARQRAVVTGKAHRVLLDLEEGSYSIEWWVSENESLGLPALAEPEPFDLGGTSLDLSPPVEEAMDYYPIPTRFGSLVWLEDELFFDGVDTLDGWLDGDQVAIVFQRDGTSDPAEIVIADDYDGRIYLAIEPLLDTVRIFDEPAE
jgi:prepilin-type N-terminal cleavage/methylation domain-containing protein